MDYTIKSGDTLSAIAKANNTTVEALSKANSIADPNKINAGAILKLPETTMAGADINAGDIKGGAPVVETPIVPTKTQTDANAISAFTDEQLKRIEAEKTKTTSALGGDTSKSTTENLITKAQERPTIDTASKLKTELETAGATAISDELKLANTKLGTLKGEVEQLDIKEQTEIDALENSAITRGAIDREKTVIQRKYASQKALKNAEYSAQAATVAALQGNYTIAKDAAKDAVDAYTYDYQQNVKTFDTLFSVYSDSLKDFDTEEKNILQVAAKNAQDTLDKVTAEKKEVVALSVDNPNAGIKITDTLAQAQEKALANPSQKAPNVIGSADTGYLQWNSQTGKWDSVGGVSGAGSGINKATKSDAAEFIVKMDAGLVGWGTAFDAMKTLHPELSNEQIDKMLEREKRKDIQPSGGQLSQWESQSVIWKWLAGDGATLDDETKKQRIMQAGLNPEDFDLL